MLRPSAVAVLLAAVFFLWYVFYVQNEPSYEIAVPVSPGSPQDVVVIRAYNCSDGVYLVYSPLRDKYAKYETTCIRLATIYYWPGGYYCEGNLRVGPDPYTGFWCPPPWSRYAEYRDGVFYFRVPAGCTPVGAHSIGRVLYIRYKC